MERRLKTSCGTMKKYKYSRASQFIEQVLCGVKLRVETRTSQFFVSNDHPVFAGRSLQSSLGASRRLLQKGMLLDPAMYILYYISNIYIYLYYIM